VAETAQKTFSRLLRDVVAPTLRSSGLQGSGTSYVLPDQDWWGQVGFQKSRSSDKSVVKFTVNLSTTLKAEWDQIRREHSYLKDTPPEGVTKSDWDAKLLEQSFFPAKPWPNTAPFMRLGHLIPDVRSDRWWYVAAGGQDLVMDEVVDAVKQYGIPALQNRMRTGIWDERLPRSLGTL
jgi:hypothetical protein